ncbi:hypothetical protein J4O76_17700 [Sphingomonas sp. NFX23]
MAAANPQRGHLGFEVEGVNWTFAFSTNALCAIEDEFELEDITGLEKVLNDKPSLRTIRTLFRIGLTDLHPTMTDVEAGEIMDAVGGLEASLELIMRAVEQAFPEAAAKGGAGPRVPAAPRKVKTARGTGRRSTPVGAKPGAAPNNTGA